MQPQTFPEVLLDRLIDAERRANAVNDRPEEIASAASVMSVGVENLLDVVNAFDRLNSDPNMVAVVNRLKKGLDSLYFLTLRIHEMALDICPPSLQPQASLSPVESAGNASKWDSEIREIVNEVKVNWSFEETKAFLRKEFFNRSAADRGKVMSFLFELGALPFDDEGSLVISETYRGWIREVHFGDSQDEQDIEEFLDYLIRFFEEEYTDDCWLDNFFSFAVWYQENCGASKAGGVSILLDVEEKLLPLVREKLVLLENAVPAGARKSIHVQVASEESEGEGDK